MPLAASFSIWEWLDIVGTFLVAIGVLGELWLLVKKFPYNPTNFPPLELKKHKFETVFLLTVCIGVSLELIALPISLYKTHVEIKTINNNVTKIEPVNQPLSDISAFMSLTVKGKIFPELTNQISKCATLMLCKNGVSGTTFPILDSDNFDPVGIGGNVDCRTYSMNFHMISFFATLMLPQQQTTKSIDEVNQLHIIANFLPQKSEILDGYVEVTINSNRRKLFHIYAQNYIAAIIATNVSGENFNQ